MNRARLTRTTLTTLAVGCAVGVMAMPSGATAATATASTSTSSDELVVADGETYTVSATTELTSLQIADGGALAVADGKALTLTVDGVETGSVLTGDGDTYTTIAPGDYSGDVVLTVADENEVTYESLTFALRQALYVDDGVVASSSVPAAVDGDGYDDDGAEGIAVRSTGEGFNGVFVAGGDYTLDDATFELDGNGRSDFIGMGSAITATGEDTRLVVDGATVDNTGVMRSGAVADAGATLVVKNSEISTHDGILADDYVSSVSTEYMQDAPWMLGISGNVRATNLLGADTVASYVNSSVTSTGWGALSTDTGSDVELTTIDTDVAVTGDSGYGAYAIGDAVEHFLGTTFDVPSYAVIMTGGSISMGDSTASDVAALNTSQDIGLTDDELADIEERATTVDSGRFGIMWHEYGTVDISGGTVIDSEEATFLDKGSETDITVDGSEGAELNPANGILMQVMTDDDPGPVTDVDGLMANTGTYTEPTTAATRDTTFDTTVAHDADAVATFTDIDLAGDFFNATREGLNMVLTFDGASVTGLLTSSTAVHDVGTITSANYEELGEVTNTPAAAVNNGTIVSLTGGATWTVTGTSYLTSLTVDADSQLVGTDGADVTVTVDGIATDLVAGTTYTGAIVVDLG